MKSLIRISFLCLIVIFIMPIFLWQKEAPATKDELVFEENTEKVSPMPAEESIAKKDEAGRTKPKENNLAPDSVETKKTEIVMEKEFLKDLTDTSLFDKSTIDIKNATTTEESVSKISFSQINITARKALVNIFCTTKNGGSFKPITGSGVVIDERGVILTNAHVAQYYLLKDYLVKDFIDCVIRTGSPARHSYKAIPIFISPSWIEANASSIIQQSPKGTGENDYALFLIKESADSSKTLPEKFSFIEPLYNSGNIEEGDDALIVAYPAGFLSGISISKDLYISSAITKVMEVFTFETGALDLFSIGGTIVAQQGSSGGAVVDGQNRLLGIIVTSSIANTTAERDLRAIAIAHINRSFVKDTGFDLQTLFNRDLNAEADAFNKNIAPHLTQLLVNELEK